MEDILVEDTVKESTAIETLTKVKNLSFPRHARINFFVIATYASELNKQQNNL